MADLPVALALVAGAVAAVNPCGFALLPAYLTVLVVRDDGDRTAALGRAVRFAAGMTVGFVAVFGVFGAVVAPLALAVERYLPVVTVAVGLVLVALGSWMLLGRSLPTPRIGVRGAGPTGAWLSQVSYGVTFALASLSCTVGPFLAVSSTAARVGDVAGVVVTFVAYALGMGTVVLVVAVAAALARSSLVARARRSASYVGRVGGALLVVAGAYVTWYGIWELRVLAGRAGADPLVDTVAEAQTEVARWIADLGAQGVLLLLGTCIGAAIVRVVTLRRAAAARTR